VHRDPDRDVVVRRVPRQHAPLVLHAGDLLRVVAARRPAQPGTGTRVRLEELVDPGSQPQHGFLRAGDVAQELGRQGGVAGTDEDGGGVAGQVPGPVLRHGPQVPGTAVGGQVAGLDRVLMAQVVGGLVVEHERVPRGIAARRGLARRGPEVGETGGAAHGRDRRGLGRRVGGGLVRGPGHHLGDGGGGERDDEHDDRAEHDQAQSGRPPPARHEAVADHGPTASILFGPTRGSNDSGGFAPSPRCHAIACSAR
jgi:hypothetical protein